VTIREYKVKDEDLLADPKSIKRGTAITSLLDAITVRVDDQGPYGEKFTWADALQGDRVAVMLSNRIFTWGEIYEFRVQCPMCRQASKASVDLTELELKMLPETSFTHVGSPKENPLSVVLPGCEKRVKFRLLRGRDDKAMQKLAVQNKTSMSSSYIRYRLYDVDGVSSSELRSWIEDLGGRDASILRAAFEEHDCGVQQEIEFECDHCNNEWLEDVKFGADFLFPKFRGKTTT